MVFDAIVNGIFLNLIFHLFAANIEKNSGFLYMIIYQHQLVLISSSFRFPRIFYIVMVLILHLSYSTLFCGVVVVVVLRQSLVLLP